MEIKNKTKLINILTFSAMGAAALYLIASLVVNYVPSVTALLMLPAGTAYEAATDRFYLMSVYITFAVIMLHALMVLFKTKKDSPYRWYHAVFTVIAALFAILFPTFMSMMGMVDITYNYTAGVFSEICYNYMIKLYQAETVVRFISVIAVALSVGAFCGGWEGKKK